LLASTLSNARDAAPSRGIVWKGVEVIAFDEPGSLTGLTDANLLDIYKKRACLADAIVVGHTGSSLSHLSAYGTAVYTDYVFVTDTLLKDNAKAPIRESQIVVTRRGGSIVLPAGPVKYESQEYPNLQPGNTYLQFLRVIPESSSYHAIDAFSTLIAEGDSWVIVRNAASARVLPEFKRGAFETIISDWLKSCK
jgi:hypothetical protein